VTQRDATVTQRDVSETVPVQAEAEAEAEAKKERESKRVVGVMDASLSLVLMKEVFDAWNSLGCVPKCLVISDKRKNTIKVRLGEPFFKANWKAAMQKIKESNFCRGISDRGWKASFDWFITPDACLKLMEGKYDNTPQPEYRNGHQKMTDKEKLAASV
jgi:hypothetical protein